MPSRQCTAECVPDCGVGRVSPGRASSRDAFLAVPVWPCVLVVGRSWRGRSSRAVTTPPLRTTLSVEALLRGTDEFSVEHWSSHGEHPNDAHPTEWEHAMTRTNLSMSVSADGFVAGPNQNEDNPLGVGGLELHGWHIGPGRTPREQAGGSDMMDGFGAFIMGRNMFGPDPRRMGRLGLERAGGETIRPTTLRPTSSPTTPTTRSRWREARPSTSSPTGSSPPTRRPRRPPETRTSRSPEEPHAPSRPSQAGPRRRGRPSGFPGDPRRGRATARRLRGRAAEARAGAGPRGARRGPPPLPRHAIRVRPRDG